MSYREKSAWISLLLYLGIYGFYFSQVAMAAARGEADGTHFLGLFGQSVAVFVVATIVLTVVAAVLAPRDAQAREDERERLITLKANSASGYVLATGAVLAIGVVFYGADEFLTINLLFFALVLSEVYKVATQLVLYRRGA
jgi:Na+/H+ antiporter NhaD/arsenite permease-like protein